MVSMKYNLIKKIRDELKNNIDLVYKAGSVKYFKESIDPYGVRTPIIRKVSHQYWQQVKTLPKNEIVALCKKLWSGKYEEFLIACDWFNRMNKKWDISDWQICEWLVNKKVSNWAHCDDFCNRCIGEFLLAYPKYVREMYKWTKSDNRWVRRASAVSFIRPLRHKKFVDDVYKIADLLINDKDDLVQKAFGWALRDAGQYSMKRLFDYLYERRMNMPRAAFRYALEKMPPDLKKKLMAK